MNKSEAIEEMKKGKKLVHRFFSDGEWISTNYDGTLYTFEDGGQCNYQMFWHFRSSKYWEDGWSIYQPK